MNLKRRGFIGCAVGALGTSVLAKSVVKMAERKRKKPNILLLFSDQHNAGFLGEAGHPDIKTPNLDRLIASGVNFNRAYCQDGVCVPSRVSMLTGKYPRTTGVMDNQDIPPTPQNLKPFPEVLRCNGYRTAAFGKRHLPRSLDLGFEYTCTTMPPKAEPSDEYYWEWIKAQGKWENFQRDWLAEFGYHLPGNQAAEMACQISNLRDHQTMEAYSARKTIEFLRDAKNSDQPFFCWTSFYRPHQPYTPLQRYADMYNPDEITLPDSLMEPVENLPPLMRNWRNSHKKPWCLALAAGDINLYRRYVAYYCALVSEIDDHIGAIMNVLNEEGLRENTIVIYTSDHGDFVGAHGMIEKCHNGHNVYEDTLRVPLIISWPGHIQENEVCDSLVELVDLYPTLLDITGVNNSDNYELAGQSLLKTLQNGSPVNRQIAISENWEMATAISARFKLGMWLKQPDNYPDMLFDRQNDPLETNNLISDSRFSDVRKKLRKQLLEHHPIEGIAIGNA